MVRFLGMLVVFLLLSSSYASAGDNPSLIITAPKQVVAGTSFTVNVEIAKNEIEGIARYQLALPQGISIEPGACSNADFEFSNQVLKLMWYRLPKTTSLKFSFKVKTHTNIKGDLTIGGSFICITSANITKNIPAEAILVDITQSSGVNPSTVVDLKNVKPKETPAEDRTLTFVPATQQMESVKMVSKALRQAPNFDPKSNSYLVSILLDKGNATKYAKLEEAIPEGYTAEPVETRGGIFDFKEGKVKFLWLELPSQTRYFVSYRLKPKGATTATSRPTISGYFAFINGDNTEVHEVAQVQDDIKKFALGSEVGTATSQGGARDIPIKYVGIAKQAGKETKAAEVKAPREEVKPTAEKKATGKVDDKAPATTTPVVATKPDTQKSEPAKETSKAVTKEAPKETSKTVTKETTKEANESTSKKPVEGVIFKVQLAAVSKEADKAGADEKFKILSSFAKEEANGLIRYLIGPYQTYQEALDAKNKAKSNGIKDVFIAPYNSKGVRISIKDAFASEKN